MNCASKSALPATLAGLAVSLSLASPAVLAQPGQGRGGFGLDPRAEDRSYHFADTNEDLPYCVFASSKVSRDTPAPLIISLHGLGATPQIMCNSTAVDLAEAGGYILASPMGYNTGGWYGSPVLNVGARGRGANGDGGQGAAGRGGNAVAAIDFDAINSNGDAEISPAEVGAFFGNLAGGRGNAAGADGGDLATQAFERWDANGDGSVTRQEFDNRPAFAGAGGRGAGGRGAGGGFGGGSQPENLAELSEKDVMNVLAMMREEFNVDPDRIYLTGHSMGGAGTLFLGSKHADIWAAIAPVAPAAFSMSANRADHLQQLKDAGVPVMIVHGDEDEAVPVSLARDWTATMEALDMEHEYVELPGVTHGPVITISQEYVYGFFDRHAK